MTDLAFVTDAGPAIGLGHLSRTATIAEAAVRDGASAAIYLPPGAPTLPASLGTGSVVHTPFTPRGLGAALGHGRQPVILDLPDEQIAALPWLKDRDGLRVAFRMFGPPQAGVVEHVSLTPAYEPPALEEGPSGALPRWSASGWDLIVVRPTLFARGDEKQVDPPLVIVTMGGADPDGLTELVCGDLLPAPMEAEIVVVIGASNPRGADLRAAFGHRLRLVDQADFDFDVALRRASLAVINGGLTRYECMAARTPFLAVSIHEQQYGITEQVTRHGFGRNLGVGHDLEPGTIVASLGDLLHDPSARAAMVAAAGDRITVGAPRRILERVRDWQSCIRP